MKELEIKLQSLKVEPKFVNVRTLSDISITFSVNQDIPNGSSIIFRFRGGRNNKSDWYYLQPYDPQMKGYVTLSLSSQVKLVPVLISGKELLIKYIVCEESGIKAGTVFHFNIFKTLVQSLVEQNKKVEVLIKLRNQKLITPDICPTINVINTKFDHVTIICPSIVSANKEFKILIRVEDKFNNLIKNFSDSIQLNKSTNSKDRDYIANLEFKEENEGIFKKFDFKISESGTYSIEAFYNGSYFKSNPIICFDEFNEKKLFWGYIHGHSNKSDGMRDVEEYFKNLINAGLNFGTVTDHDHKWETSDEDFEDIKRIVKKYHTEEFVSFFGYEYGSWYTGYGDICIYHYDEDLPILRSDVNKYNSTKKLIRNLKSHKGKVLLIAHHSALRPGYRNWDYFDNSIEKLVEIYSTWGSQENSHKDGNRLPPRYKFFGYGKYARKRGPILEKKGSFVQDALKRGYKLGFTAGGDDHFGIYPSGPVDPDNGIYPSGIMAVWAKQLTKESIWNALLNRRCYGSTGPRVIIEFHLDQFFMGDIIDLEAFSQLKSKREINVKIISPIKINKVELIRNNSIYKFFDVNSNVTEFNLIDEENFKEFSLTHTNSKEKFAFYYPRIILEDKNMAWASPIWLIDKL